MPTCSGRLRHIISAGIILTEPTSSTTAPGLRCGLIAFVTTSKVSTGHANRTTRQAAVSAKLETVTFSWSQALP